MKQKIIKYLPDIMIFLGIFIVTYSKFAPRGIVVRSFPEAPISWELRVAAIMLIAVGINIAIRRYFSKRNSE